MSNGGTEVGVGIMRGMFRTMELCLEERLDKTMPVDHPFVAWLMEHSAMMLNAVVKGQDGLTPWMRIRGRAWSQPLVGIGESVLYRYPSKGPKHHPEGNVGALGAEGIFVGYSRSSNTFLVSAADGEVVSTRSITRRPESDRWHADALSRVQAIPNSPTTRKPAARVRFEDGATERGQTAEVAPPAAAT